MTKPATIFCPVCKRSEPAPDLTEAKVIMALTCERFQTERAKECPMLVEASREVGAAA